MSRRCPDCRAAMQALFVKGKVGKEVALDRCITCGGLWFDFSKLEALVGRALKFEPLDGDTSRRCPDCTLTLTPVLYQGGIPIEVCSTCRGQWLDWSDVQELDDEVLELALRPPATAERLAHLAPPDDDRPMPLLTGFACAKCKKRAEFASGHATSRGLVCDSCVPKVQNRVRQDLLTVGMLRAAFAVLWRRLR